jgi:steroid delta-isomerase-like uncharacterized protein
MSVEHNKAILQRAARNFSNAATRNDYLDLYAADIVLHGYQGVEPGIASAAQFYQAFWDAFPDCVLHIEDMVAEADKIACRFVVRGSHRGVFQGIPPTGKPISLSGITILRFVDGRCVERWSQADFMGLLQQLGVLPEPAQANS